MNNLLKFALVSIVCFAGCKGEDESVANKAGTKVGEALTDFASGVGKGIDKQLAVNVELAPALAELGVSKTVAKSTVLDAPSSSPAGSDSERKGITVYLVATHPLKSRLIARAMNKEGQEVGRSDTEVDFAADDAKYVTFGFPNEMDTQLVERYVIDIKK
ncbi:MAG: hypothetical protein GX616_07700 [Planctomycetes bacterium]|nr:hypothetical protein [Planctomycetota bacterium]